jgi:hypothetical protein
MTTNDSLCRLSDADLLLEVKHLAAIERRATADLIQSLCEVEARQLHLAIGCSSMFGYCTDVLHLSEHAAYARIAAARAAVRFPLVRDLLVEGAITLTTVTLLARHLTDENQAALLESARHKRKVDVEMIVATLNPQPDVRSAVRKMPNRKRVAAAPSVSASQDGVALSPVTTSASASTPATAPLLCEGARRSAPAARRRATEPPRAPIQPAAVRVLAPERYKLQVTISAATREKLRRAQDLLWHTTPRADEAAIIDRALTLFVEQLEKVKYGRTGRARQAVPCHHGTRHVPAHVRRAVSERDGDRCAFIGSEGRCPETAGLEYHHRVPFADGGPTTVDNLELRCRAHNAYEAEKWFGPLFVREVPSMWGALGLDQVADG